MYTDIHCIAHEITIFNSPNTDRGRERESERVTEFVELSVFDLPEHIKLRRERAIYVRSMQIYTVALN